jgi:hypothetical protein
VGVWKFKEVERKALEFVSRRKTFLGSSFCCQNQRKSRNNFNLFDVSMSDEIEKLNNIEREWLVFCILQIAASKFSKKSKKNSF